MKIKTLIALLITSACFSNAYATVIIEYDYTSLGGNNYQVDYTLANNSLFNIVQLDIQGATGNYANVTTLDCGLWNLMLCNNFSFITEGSPATEILPGETGSGGSFIFDWLGASGSMPSVQLFTAVLFDDASAVVVGNFSGITTGDNDPIIINTPEPSTMGLLGLALGFLGFISRKKIS